MHLYELFCCSLCELFYVNISLLCEPILGLFDNAIYCDNYCDIYCDTTNRERCRTCTNARTVENIRL